MFSQIWYIAIPQNYEITPFENEPSRIGRIIGSFLGFLGFLANFVGVYL